MARRVLPDHLRVPWTGRDAWLFCLGWFGLQFLVVFWLSVLAAVMPGGQALARLLQSDSVWVNLAYSLFDAVVGFGLLWLLLRKYQTSWRALGWRRFSWTQMMGYVLGLLLAFTVVIGMVLWLVTALVPGFNANQPQTNEFTGVARTYPGVALFALVLLPPVIEETVFRGFLFPALAGRMGVVWGAIISSALFGLAHWQANISVYTFVLGLVLCFMYVRLRSIVPGIALHMLNNYLAFMALSGR